MTVRRYHSFSFPVSKTVHWLLLPVWLVAMSYATPLPAQTYELKMAPSPADNPLKGLVPYARPYPNRFPHSLEFSYLGLSQIMFSETEFDWKPMEGLLDDISSRGNQAVVRIFLEYPGKKEGIPKYLIDAGLKVHRYMNTNTAPFPPTEVTTPDYEDPKLHTALKNFIAEFGKKYDGDPRLGYITAGLLGTWGEWHTYPRNDLWASKKTQAMVMDAYTTAFRKTPVLLRYPAGSDSYAHADNASRPFGYHDDSFAWATLITDRKEDNWFFLAAMKQAGKSAEEKWKTQPIGGEIRPELWGKIFDDPTTWPKEAQDFGKCVEETHATWLMDTGMFREEPTQARRERAEKEVRRMGYDLFIQRCQFDVDRSKQSVTVSLDVQNLGVAPFYADWPTEFCFLTDAGEVAYSQPIDTVRFTGILPSDSAQSLVGQLDISSLKTGEYTILMRVVNPLPNGKPLRFANQTQDAHKAGYLSLGSFQR